MIFPSLLQIRLEFTPMPSRFRIGAGTTVCPFRVTFVLSVVPLAMLHYFSCIYLTLSRSQVNAPIPSHMPLVWKSRIITEARNAGPVVIQNDADLTSICIQITLICMRTTIDIPEELIEEARRILGFKSKTDTVIVSLQEMIRKKRIEELKSLMGAVELKIDLDQSRRRPSGKRKRRGKS